MFEKVQNYTNIAGFEELPILINAMKGSKTGMIQTSDGEQIVVRLSDWLLDGVELHDRVEVERDSETGELVVVDYYISFEGTDKFVTGYDEEYEEEYKDIYEQELI